MQICSASGCLFAAEQGNCEIQWGADEAAEARSLVLSFTCSGMNPLPLLQQSSSGLFKWEGGFQQQPGHCEKALKNCMTNIKQHPTVSTPSASKQSIHTELCSCLKGYRFALVEMYSQEASVAQEVPATYYAGIFAQVTITIGSYNKASEKSSSQHLYWEHSLCQSRTSGA